MDRQLVYPGAIPLETDLLSTNRNTMIGLAKLAAAIMGSNTFLNGLACTPDSPASLNVKIGPGEIYSLKNIDSTAYSSLASDTAHSIMKQGILLDTVLLACPAPVTSGHSINYLVQVAYQDVDANPVVLPYYNASNPAMAYSGPSNSGSQNYTTRKGVCTVSVKAGTSAPTGSQATPTADAGYVAAYTVTVAYGQTQILSSHITFYFGAPFIPAGGLIVGGMQKNKCISTEAFGTADVLKAVFYPAITTLPAALDGVLTLYVRPTAANATTTPTFTPHDGLVAPKTIVKGNGLALAAGDIAGAGHWLQLQYDATLDKWVLLNPATGVIAPTNPGLGVGQTWTDMSASRTLGATYTNSTGKPICLAINVGSGAVSATDLSISVNSGTAFVFAHNTNSGGGVGCAGTIVVPVGATYNVSSSSGTLSTWYELR